MIQNIDNEEYEAAGYVLAADLRGQLALLLATPVGTVVLDREFGIDHSFVDMPLPIAQNMLASELAYKVERYIPELKLNEIILTSASEDGHMNLKVVVDYA